MTELQKRRLASQRLSGNPAASAQAVVTYFGALQAQDYAMARWAIGVRLAGASDAAVSRAIEKGEIIRTHVLRPTWHLVPAQDLGWMLDLSAGRIAQQMKSADAKLGIDPKLIARSNDEIGKWLSGKSHVTRQEMMAHLQGKGIATSGTRGIHLAMHAEINQIICSGKPRGKEQTYAAFGARIPTMVRLSHEEALAQLAKRYFRSHGPATLRDFIWWSGLSAGEAKMALASVETGFKKEDIGGMAYYYEPSGISGAESVQLLPAFDEYLIAYADRSGVIAHHHKSHAFTSNGIFRPLVVVDGRVCGTWKRVVKGGTVVVEVALLDKIARRHQELLERQASEYAGFIGKTLQFKI